MPPHLYTPLYIHMAPCMFLCPHTFVHPPGGVHTPMGPMLCAFAWFWSIGCCGGVVFLLNVYWDTPPLFGGASPLITPPHSIVGSLYIVILRDISSYVGLSPSIEGFWGVPPSLGEVWGAH